MSAPAVAEPPAVKSVSSSPRGASDLFKAVQANEDAKRGYNPPNASTAISGPAAAPVVEPPKPVVAPTPPAPPAPNPEAPKPPVGQPTDPVKVDNPLDLLKEPEGAKPAAPAEDAELAAKMAEWDKELPTTPEIKTQSSKDSWDKMRESYKASKREAHTAHKEREALQAEIAKLKEAPPVAAVPPEEVESLRKENMTLKQKNAVWALETDPNFQNQVLRPLEGAQIALGSLMETYKITAPDLDKAFMEADRIKRNKLFNDIITDSGMNPLDVEDFKKAISTVTDLSYKRDEGYANAEKFNEAAKAQLDQQTANKAEMSKKQIQEEEGKVWEKVKGSSNFKDLVADPLVASSIRQKVKDTLSSEMTHEERVIMAYVSHLGVPMSAKLKEQATEITSLKEALQKAIGGESLAGGGHPPSRTPNTQPDVFKPGQAVGQAMRDWERATGKR